MKHRRMRRQLGAAVVAAAMLSACSGGGHAAPKATVPVERTTTTTNPYAVPAVIDVAYVNKVLAALDHLSGDATRILLQQRQLSPDYVAHLRAFLSDEGVRALENINQAELAAGLKDYRQTPGDPHTTVVRSIRLARDCLYTETRRDLGAITTSPQRIYELYTALKPLPPERDSAHLNPTGWQVVLDEPVSSSHQGEDPCVA